MQKILIPHGDPWHAHRMKDCTSSKKQRRESWLPFSPSIPGGREAGVQQPELKARDCCNLSPTDRIFHQTVSRLPAANHVFLGSWMVHIGQECHSLRSAPRGDTQHTWNCALMPGKLSGQDQGGTYSAWPTRDSVCTKHLVV